MPPPRSEATAQPGGSPADRLLVATSTFPASLDEGGPRFVYDLAAALAEHLEVTVLAPDAPGLERRERWGRVDVERFPYFWPRGAQRLAYGGGMRENLRDSWWIGLQVPAYFWAQVRSIRRLVRRRRIGFVNSHWLVPQGLGAALARGRRPRFRHVLHVHAADVYMLRRLPLGAVVARYVVSRCDAVFAAGSHVRQMLDELMGRPSGAVLQPMGVDVAAFRDADVEPASSSFADGYLLFVGRFVEKKGLEYLIRSLPAVLGEHPRLGLRLVGYGPLEPALREEVARLGLDHAVEFLGRRTHAEVVGQLRGCRVAVVPSIIDSRGETEGMPTVVVESLAAGARVVASAVDGIPDVLRHRENGWLCRPADPEDLAEKILLALEGPPESPVVAEAYDWQRVAENYLACLRRLETAIPTARG